MSTCPEPVWPSAEASEPCDCHGRRLTTTREAAADYRTAQANYQDIARMVAALRRAIRADRSFVLADADLAALERQGIDGGTSTLHSWERHHVEIVGAAATGDTDRAIDLLREHLAEVRCDPIATAVVINAADDAPLDDIIDRLPACHRRAD